MRRRTGQRRRSGGRQGERERGGLKHGCHLVRPELTRRDLGVRGGASRHGVHQFAEGWAGRGVFRQAGVDHRAQGQRNAGEVGLAVHDAETDRERLAAGERRHTRRGEREHAAEREDVAFRSDGVALGLLGRHVGGRADRRVGGGDHCAARRPGDAEVDDPRPVGGNEDVAWLEVAVHKPLGVDRLQRLGQAAGQPPHGVLRQRPGLGDQGRQRRPGHERGGEPRRTVISPGADDRCGIGVADRLRGGHLTPETLHELGVAGQVGVHDLDRHRPPAR